MNTLMTIKSASSAVHRLMEAAVAIAQRASIVMEVGLINVNGVVRLQQGADAAIALQECMKSRTIFSFQRFVCRACHVMSGIFFKPWKGKRYESNQLFGKRILVLGESHYEWDENIPLYPDLTIDCIREQAEGIHTSQFWTNIAVAFLNKRPSQEEKKEFWDSIAFYNYVQKSVGFGPRVRPTEDMWRISEQGFVEVLAKLLPKVVIVLGYALWQHLPELGGRNGPKIIGSEQTDTWHYPLPNAESCLAYAIRHPSAGFSGPYWYRYVQQAILLA
jgi:hypothetical protein